ncbi:uncharacterized protein LOC116202959 isoform X2 [Punica granatum]|uniref:Uncharacterized protein LOC116202959 isoform X2 n=1 Tax=Punica granatum TaxID=22663 RepID=A0A6P8DGG3_PUNGR|nr:uncharacterized protein LOC116202959 isoform X2 [Punica granatum]
MPDDQAKLLYIEARYQKRDTNASPQLARASPMATFTSGYAAADDNRFRYRSRGNRGGSVSRIVTSSSHSSGTWSSEAPKGVMTKDVFTDSPQKMC